MRHRYFAICVLAASIPVVATPAFADGAPADEAFARGLGLQQANQFSAALDAFIRAYRSTPSPQSLLHIAECEIALGRLARAEDHLHALVDAALPEGSPPEMVAAQAQGKIELAELSPRVRVGWLTLRVFPPSDEGLLVTLDGLALNDAQLGRAQRVDAGSHVVVAAAKDRLPVTTTVTVPEGQAVSARVTLGVYAPTATNWEPGHKLSPGLAQGGIAITILGGVAMVAGGVYVVGASFACFMTCKPDATGMNAAGAVVLSGLGAALLVGVPMIVIGNQTVSGRVALSPRGAQLDWAF